MVDKSQQTEITEKRKAMALVQPPAPKATHSIGNIPGSKDNYSRKEYESLRLSSQLQKTLMKRKHVQDMTDKSLQTDPIVEEKVELIFIDKTLKLEENTAGVGEIAPELPQSIPEVEIPTSRPTSHLIDRSQQTSCTGDWSLIYICPKEKVDKEQQTYFSELEITIRSMPGSSMTKSKEETIPIAQEGPLVEINGSLEIEVLSPEELPDVMMSFTEGEISGELQALSNGEATVKGELFLTEEIPIQDASEEVAPSEVLPPSTEEGTVKDLTAEVLSTPTEEGPTEVPPQPTEEGPAEVPLSEEGPAEVPLAPAEEVPAEVLPPPAEEAPAEVPPPLTEEGPAEVPPPLTEEGPEEVPPLPAEEAPTKVPPSPAEKGSAEVSPPQTEEGPAEVPPPPAEEFPTEVPSSSAEEGSSEVPLPPTAERPEEAPPPATEEGLAEVPPPPTEESPTHDVPTEVQLPQAKESPGQVLPLSGESTAEEAIAQVQPPSFEKAPLESLPLEEVEKIHLDNLSFEVQPLPTEDIAIGVPGEFQALPADENPAREDTVETQPSSFEGAPIAENPVEAPLPASEADTGREDSAVHPLSLAPTDEAPAEIQILQTDNIPTEVAPVENQPLPAEEVFPEVVSEEEATAAEVRFPLSEGAPAQEATVEAQLTSVEESPKRASADVQPLSPETPVEESSVVDPPLKTNEVTMQEFRVEKMPAEDPLPPSEQIPADQVLLKEHRLSQVADISEKELESTLTSDKMSEGIDSVPEDVSGTKDDQISTFKIEGTIKIELKN
uniref:Fibrous sheath CABYR-binding protein n=1 Tax=Mus spicilegus TaxID=10103 RepID=A0A8C6GU88_MUSSI